MDRIRTQIDRIDRDILKLVARRMSCARSIGAYKKKKHLPVLQPKREVQILASKTSMGKKLKLRPDFVKTVFKALLTESKRIQKKV